MSHDMDLNIRAAKALGLEFDKDGLSWQGDHSAAGLQFPIRLHGMEFHDSFDWAMLGVKECGYKKIPEYLEILRTAITGNPSRYCRTNFATNQLCGMIMATPTQITQAWVEVLETHNPTGAKS